MRLYARLSKFRWFFVDFRRVSGMRGGGMLVAVVAITIAAISLPGCCGELYTALADMEELLETEAVLIDTLNGYIKAQEERLATLRQWVPWFWLHSFLFLGRRLPGRYGGGGGGNRWNNGVHLFLRAGFLLWGCRLLFTESRYFLLPGISFWGLLLGGKGLRGFLNTKNFVFFLYYTFWDS